MDALDEFFRVWCEPEAWCDRCKDYPAIHIAVQDSPDPYSSRVTYVRVWDPYTQTHVALCRQCNQQHTAALGSQAFQYAPRTSGRLRASHWQENHQNVRQQRLHYLPRRLWHLFTRLVCLWRGWKPSPTRLPTKSYSRTGT